jgi:Insect cuticle protein
LCLVFSTFTLKYFKCFKIDKIHLSLNSYELSDGQIRAEVGELKDVTDAEGQTTKALVVTGAYSFVGPDGQTYWVTFTADETGFHPIIGTGGAGGPQPGGDYGINPNALKSLIG